MEKLSHAYIVSSASAEARSSMARLLAAQMLCSGNSKPCGVCRDCRKVSAGVHPDLCTVRRLTDDKGNPKRDIQVGQVRDMLQEAYILPNEASGRVFVIEDADTMNAAAQNAALKLLEEPPANVYFILCAENPDRLLPTVRSRCANLRRNTEAEGSDGETLEAAAEYLRLVGSGDEAELLAWCIAHENLSIADTVSLLEAAKVLETDMLCGRRGSVFAERRQIAENMALLDRCIEYLRVNTGVKHIFGLLAVKSVPAKK